MFTPADNGRIVPIVVLLHRLNVLKNNSKNTYHMRIRQIIALEELAIFSEEFFGEEKPTQ